MLKCPKCGSQELSVEEEYIVKKSWDYYEDSEQFECEETIATYKDKRCSQLWFQCAECDKLWNLDQYDEFNYPRGELDVRSVEKLNQWLRSPKATIS